MKKRRSVFKSLTFMSVMLSLSVIGTVIYYAARENWVFFDATLRLEGFTLILLWIMILNSAALGLMSALKVRKYQVTDKKPFVIASIVSCLLALITFCVAVGFFVGLAFGEPAEAYFLFLKSSLYDCFWFITVPFILIFFDRLEKRGRTAVAVLIGAAVGVIILSKLVPLYPYDFTSEPSVIDTGSGYSVVFSVNDTGTGYVEYTYEGKDYRVYDENGGRLNSDSRIHSIQIPYEHLNGNSYKVGSVRVIEQYSYGSRLGKEIVSKEYSFSETKGDNLTWLVVSDWHTYLERAYSAVSYAGEYDGVILLGDASPGVDFEQQVISNVVEFAGELTKGSKPLIYVRGNHETRGEYAGKLLDALGLDEFYYTVDAGAYSFVVLDSGEDKDDSHREYGGMTDYNTYRADMIDWLGTVEVKNEKVIALSHSWKISDVEKELSYKGWQELERLGVRVMLSGHIHKCRLLGEGSDAEKEMFSRYSGIVGYADGGNVGKNTYVASKLTLSDEKIIIEAFDNHGEKVFDHMLEW